MSEDRAANAVIFFPSYTGKGIRPDFSRLPVTRWFPSRLPHGLSQPDKAERWTLATLAEGEAIPCLPQSGGQGRNTAQEGEEDHHEHEEQEQGPFRTRGGAFPCLCVAGAGQEGFLNTATLVIDLGEKGWWVLC